MNKDFDSLLDEGPLDVPDNFVQSVMQRIHSTPLPAAHFNWLEKLQNAALIASSILGFAQLAAFMFSVWAVTSAG